MHRWLPGTVWRGPAAERTVYLTFDDGPIPEETPWVLEQLAEYNAKALFFCVGDNVERHPEIAKQVVEAGHQLGNHTHHHLSGWTTSRTQYLTDIARCQEALERVRPQQQPFFRPPYGRITPGLSRTLSAQYQVIMWDLLTCDYDASYAPEACLRDALRLTRPGAVVVFHDSLKASRNLRYVLPRYLAELAERGYQFAAL